MFVPIKHDHEGSVLVFLILPLLGIVVVLVVLNLRARFRPRVRNPPIDQPLTISQRPLSKPPPENKED
jgi:hypothetical protein